MTAPCCNPRASNRTQFGESMRSSKVSSMVTIRSSSGMRAMSALSSVVLPLPVPPLTRIFRRVCNTRSASSRMCAGSVPCATSCAAEKDRVAKAPHGDGHVRAGRGHTDGHARAVVQARIEDRRRGRVQAQGPGDMDRRPLQRRRVERGRVDRPEPAVAFEPHVPRPVGHDFAHVRIVERGLQAPAETVSDVNVL